MGEYWKESKGVFDTVEEAEKRIEELDDEENDNVMKFKVKYIPLHNHDCTGKCLLVCGADYVELQKRIKELEDIVRVEGDLRRLISPNLAW